MKVFLSKFCVFFKRFCLFAYEILGPKFDFISREEAAMLVLEKTVEIKWRPVLIETVQEDKTVINIQDYKLRHSRL